MLFNARGRKHQLSLKEKPGYMMTRNKNCFPTEKQCFSMPEAGTTNYSKRTAKKRSCFVDVHKQKRQLYLKTRNTL